MFKFIDYWIFFLIIWKIKIYRTYRSFVVINLKTLKIIFSKIIYLLIIPLFQQMNDTWKFLFISMRRFTFWNIIIHIYLTHPVYSIGWTIKHRETRIDSYENCWWTRVSARNYIMFSIDDRISFRCYFSTISNVDKIKRNSSETHATQFDIVESLWL